MANETLPATAFKSPAIALSGVVDYEMYTKFRTQFDNASDQNVVVIELSTLGGDPEVARMMGEDGPLTTCVAVVKATLNEIECSIAIQNEGFQNLVLGSSVSLDEVLKNAPSNWYLEAQEAKSLGLVEAVL